MSQPIVCRVCVCVSPQQAVRERFYSRELLNNLHPPRRSFWALFVKGNLQLTASGGSSLSVAPNLSHMQGGIAPALPPHAAWSCSASPEHHHRAGLGVEELLLIPVQTSATWLEMPRSWERHQQVSLVGVQPAGSQTLHQPPPAQQDLPFASQSSQFKGGWELFSLPGAIYSPLYTSIYRSCISQLSSLQS